MRRALLGGSFDPIHTGHLLLAEQTREAFRLDRVCFVPTCIPPHKARPQASPAHRLAMIRLAIRGNTAFEVNDWEIKQERTVYTYEALAHFRSLWPKDELFFILGTDSLKDIERWKQGRQLLQMCKFLAVERPETPWSLLPERLRRGAQKVPAIPVPFASSEIRGKLQKKRSIRYQVPEAVEVYIRKHHLYATSRS